MGDFFGSLIGKVLTGLGVAAVLALFVWLRPRRTPSPPLAPPPAPPGEGPLTTPAEDRPIASQRPPLRWPFWLYAGRLTRARAEVRYHFLEGRHLQDTSEHQAAVAALERALAAAEDDNQRCALHSLIGVSLAAQGRLLAAETEFRRALQLSELAADLEGRAAALGNLALLYRRARDKEGQGASLANLGSVYAQMGDLDRAEEHHNKALAIHQETGDRLGQAQDLGNLGIVCAHRGQLEKAEDRHKKALAIHQEIGNRRGQANQLGNLGTVYEQRGRLDNAEEHYKKALPIHEEVGDRLGQANQLGNLGVLQQQAGNTVEALRYLRRARRIFAEVGASLELQKTDQVIHRLEGGTPRKPAPKKPPPKPC